jgi:hypothetical protein
MADDKPTDRGRGASPEAVAELLQGASRFGGYLIVAMVVPIDPSGDGGGGASMDRQQRALGDIADQSEKAAEALSSRMIVEDAARRRRTAEAPAQPAPTLTPTLTPTSTPAPTPTATPPRAPQGDASQRPRAPRMAPRRRTKT